MAPVILSSGRAVPIEIKRHARAKRFVLRVSAGVIQLTVPRYARIADGVAWAHSQRAYVEKKLAGEVPPIPLAMGSELMLLGERVTVVPGLKVPGERVGESFEIAPAEPDMLAKRIEKRLRKDALSAAQSELRSYWEQLGVENAPVSVRSYKRRWGACGPDGSTALNWRLIFAPRPVFSYVAAHEAAHRLEMNHSQRFWNVVRSIYPNHKTAEAWLRDHGAQLYAYGAEPPK